MTGYTPYGETSDAHPVTDESVPPDMSFSVSRFAYIVVMISFLMLLVFGIVNYLSSPDALIFAVITFSISIVPLVISLKLICTPPVLILTQETLKIVGNQGIKEIPYTSILITYPKSFAGIATSDEILPIPRFLKPRRSAFFDELETRMTRACKEAHTIRPEDIGITQYSLVPRTFLDIYRDLAADEKAADALLFSGSVHKRSRFRLRLREISTALMTAGGTLLILSPWHSPGFLFAGAGIFLFSGSCFLFTFLPRYKKTERAWLLLSKEGIAMKSTKNAGELLWCEIERIPPRNTVTGFLLESKQTRQCVHIKTHDGITITINDLFDAPAPVIGRLCREYFRNHRRRASKSKRTEE